MACSNYVEPLQLPFTNVSLPAIGPKAFSRGISISIGTPPQQLRLLPALDSNHTWVSGGSLCTDPSDVECKTRLGGVYEPLNSSTAAFTSLKFWNDTDQDPNAPDYWFPSDLLLLEGSIHLKENTTLFGCPLMVNIDCKSHLAGLKPT
jgi:hypothetical protein